MEEEGLEAYLMKRKDCDNKPSGSPVTVLASSLFT